MDTTTKKTTGIAQVEEGIPMIRKPTTIEVTAPSTLPGGFQFSCEAQGKRFTVRVPDEGVKQGQVFQAEVVMQTEEDVEDNIDTHDIPRGHWRDGLCDCFNHCGSCMVAFCCQPCALGQVMARFNLGFCGNPLPAGESHRKISPFKVFWALVAFLCALAFVKGCVDGDAATTGNYPDWYAPLVAFMNLIQYALTPYFIFITYKTYRHVAQRYEVSDGSQEPVTMCLESTFCRPCVTARMIRHTANHEKYAYNMCEERGLAPHAPVIV